MTKIRFAVVATVALGACAPAAAQQGQGGRLVIVGGGLSRDNEAVYRAVLDARDGDGPLCIIPTAGAGDPEATIAGSVASFERWSAAGAARGITISTANPEAANDTAVARAIGECSGFWFTGGVQSRIATVFRPGGDSTAAYRALLRRHREGAVVAGSSAGAAIMSDPMIAAGSTSGALAHGISRIAAEADEDDDADVVRGVAISTGLGFFPGALVDQHFLARGRVGRLITAVLELDEYDLGFGIDENTALVVEDGGVRAVGASGVVVIDARDARRSGRSASGVRLHLLGADDRFELATREVTAAADKAPLPKAQASGPGPETDPFARWQFLRLLHDFAATDAAEWVLRVEGGELTLRKGPSFAAHARAGAGVQSLPAGFGIRDIRLDVRRPAAPND